MVVSSRSTDTASSSSARRRGGEHVKEQEEEASLSSIIDTVGNAIADLKSGYDAEAGPRGESISVASAFHALRRAGCSFPEDTVNRWSRYHGCSETTTRLSFGAFVRLYHELTRLRRWARPLPSDRNGILIAGPPAGGSISTRSNNRTTSSTKSISFAPASGGGPAPDSSSLLAALLKAPVHGRDSPVVGGTAPPAASQPEEEVLPSLREAFARFDLYGDTAAPGEVAWEDLPAALAACGVNTDTASIEAHAQRRDIKPHYPVDLRVFKMFAKAFESDATRATCGLAVKFVLDESTRRAEARQRHQQHRGKEEEHIIQDSCRPLMDPETIELRREALRRSRRKQQSHHANLVAAPSSSGRRRQGYQS